ncbi:MAG: hypothetical protein NZL95_03465 [Chitinophagales bacterium]|nr:hypothetical protein [Chitinophagales bacterium]MDW8427588.1 hypothetical protein [Chitinophagales bacterium]
MHVLGRLFSVAGIGSLTALSLAAQHYTKPLLNIADTLEEDTTLFIVYIPYHSWSTGLGYSSLPSVVQQFSILPDNLDVQWWLGNRFYMQAGLFTQPDGIVPDNLLFSRGFAVYSGVLFKLFMFPHAYFTPSFNVYFDRFARDSTKQYALTAGPAVGFEYFFSKRFSVATNLFGGGYGWAHQNIAHTDGRYSIHWAIGLSCRYNFDWPRAQNRSLIPEGFNRIEPGSFYSRIQP